MYVFVAGIDLVDFRRLSHVASANIMYAVIKNQELSESTAGGT